MDLAMGKIEVQQEAQPLLAISEGIKHKVDDAPWAAPQHPARCLYLRTQRLHELLGGVISCRFSIL